jgi:hypothetical protein
VIAVVLASTDFLSAVKADSVFGATKSEPPRYQLQLPISRITGQVDFGRISPCCTSPVTAFTRTWGYFRVARDPGTIFGHKLVAPVVPAGASLA